MSSSQATSKGDDWTDEENDLIVADYFSMLADEVAGRQYNKAERNRSLQARIGRTKGSIEYKHQNISAVLKELGQAWIRGYKPAAHFQWQLVDAVGRWLAAQPDWIDRPLIQPRNEIREPVSSYQPSYTLDIHAPPSIEDGLRKEQLQIIGIAEKFDFARRDERNRQLGRAGEEFVLEFERYSLKTAGRRDLASQVRWVSEEDGDGAGYDIASFRPDGKEKLIEVKTTNRGRRMPFYITRNELAVSQKHSEHWCLLRLWDFRNQPSAFELRPPLQDHVSLNPTIFRATFDRV